MSRAFKQRYQIECLNSPIDEEDEIVHSDSEKGKVHTVNEKNPSKVNSPKKNNNKKSN